MNPSNLPPQGRYADDRLQQMVLDELGRQGITPEKFYFTSDDWMVSYDGSTPAWNSVFGIAAYHQNGQSQYAECGVSQRYDPATSQWGAPAASVKTGLPLSEEAFQAAPSSLGGAESSQTVLAESIPRLPAQDGTADETPAVDMQTEDAQAGSEFPSGEEWSAAERADGLPRVEPGPGHEWHHTEREPEPERAPVPSGDEWSSAEPAASPNVDDGRGAGEPIGTDLRQAGDLGVAEQPSESGSGATHTGAGAAGADAAVGAVGVGAMAAATSGGDQTPAASSGSAAAEIPSYESAAAEAEAREHPEGGHHAKVAGYALRVKEDGTAELQVPLGGQVTLRWAGPKHP